jgi:hypothetical protein
VQHPLDAAVIENRMKSSAQRVVIGNLPHPDFAFEQSMKNAK